MDYKISNHTWIPFEDGCDSCLNPCSGQLKTNCIPDCDECEFVGSGFPCTHCSALLDPEIPGRIYFQPKEAPHDKPR